MHGCPSWHHQAVLSTEGTDLIVSGMTETNGEEMIEIIEYRNKDFIIGFQFHPEAAFVKYQESTENASEFMNFDASLRIFDELIKHAG